MTTGDVLKWMGKAPAERASLPAAVVSWTAAEIMHFAGIPGLDIGLSAAAVTAIAYGRVARRSKNPKHARHVAMGGLLTGGWMTAATAIGPLAGPYHLVSLLWLGGTLSGYAWLRRHETVRAAREWRQAKAGWLATAHHWGLGGSHLLEHERTRLGERMVIDVTGTGRRASQIAASGLHERIAEDEMLPKSRVQVAENRIAGRVEISIRRKDPWKHPIPHPVLADEPEVTLPVPCTARVPLPVGQDPETGELLTLPVWDADGAKNVFLVGLKGAGKSVLLNNLRERLTAARDALVIDINLSKAQEDREWAPACHLTAIGRDQKARALQILRVVHAAIDWRSQPRDTANLEPTPEHPLIVVIIDEIDTAAAIPAIKKELRYIASKGRSEAAALILAGQRGTADWMGGTDVRSQIDVFGVGQVSRRGEAMHAAGDLGLAMPDMASYGEGHKGVWALTELGGTPSVGRTFRLDKPADLRHLAESRAHRQPDLEPGLVDHLGNGYAALLAGDVFARWAAEHPSTDSDAPVTGSGSYGDMPAEYVALARLIRDGEIQADDDFREKIAGALEIHERQADSLDRWDKDMTDALPPELRERLDRMAAREADSRRLLAEASAAELPDVPAEKIAEHRRARWDQVAEQAEIPDDAREKLVRLLAGEGTTISKAAEALGVKPWATRKYLERLRFEGIAEVIGEKRGARWRLTPPEPAEEDGDPK